MGTRISPLGEGNRGREKIFMKVFLFSKSECCWAIIAALGTERDALKKAGQEIKSEKWEGGWSGTSPRAENAMWLGVGTAGRSPRSQDVRKPCRVLVLHLASGQGVS